MGWLAAAKAFGCVLPVLAALMTTCSFMREAKRNNLGAVDYAFLAIIWVIFLGAFALAMHFAWEV